MLTDAAATAGIAVPSRAVTAIAAAVAGSIAATTAACAISCGAAPFTSGSRNTYGLRVAAIGLVSARSDDDAVCRANPH